MKKLLFYALGVPVMFFSCKKSAPSGSGTLSATINGVNETFNTGISAWQLYTAGSYNISVTGYHGTANASDQVGFLIEGAQPINAGTYQYSILNPHSDAVQLIFDQYEPGGNNDFVNDPNNVTNPVTVVITSITSTNIQGTFSGVLPSSSGGSVIETVTNGKFNVTLQQ